MKMQKESSPAAWTEVAFVLVWALEKKRRDIAFDVVLGNGKGGVNGVFTRLSHDPWNSC